MNTKMNPLKSFSFFTFLISFSFIVLMAFFPISSANADENSGYYFESHKGFSPDAGIDGGQLVMDDSGQIYYFDQDTDQREVCKLNLNGNDQCTDLMPQTADFMPPSQSNKGSIILDKSAHLYITFTGGPNHDKVLAIKINAFDLSIASVWTYQSDAGPNPYNPANLLQPIAFLSGDLLAAAVMLGGQGDPGNFYLLTMNQSGSPTFSPLPCPNGAATCPNLIPFSLQLLTISPSRHILSITYDDGSAQRKVQLIYLNGYTAESQQVITLSEETNISSDMKLDSDGHLIFEDDTNKIYYFNVSDGVNITPIKTVTIPNLSTISAIESDGQGNTFVEGKIVVDDQKEVIRKIDKNSQITNIPMSKDASRFNMFKLPDGCIYMTEASSSDKNTDLYRSCQGGELQFLNSFDFKQTIQTQVLYQGSTNAAHPDVYVFTYNPPGYSTRDLNDFSTLKYKSFPSPTPSPTPPGPAPTPPSPNPYPDTGINLYDTSIIFVLLSLSAASGILHKRLYK
ncbi:MAG: hypothetical protein LBB10_01310 [Bifidobacteriaceae bacterium]|jgi:hypothetical protein|nr:hypothetical protein [Bifidobacteriaceae bacterium]